jgi:FKBP-type peptidyl-prolyl cis-trans isomerase
MRLGSILLFLVSTLLLHGCIQSNDSDLDRIIDRDDKIIKEFIARNNITATETAIGFHYTKLIKNDVGNQFVNRDVIGIYYEIKTLEGRVIETYLDETKPAKLFLFNEGGLIPRAINFGASIAKVGESLILYVPSYLAYQEYSFSQLIPANANLIIQVKYARVFSSEEILEMEEVAIEQYIARSNLTGFTRTADGLFIRTTEPGDASSKAAGNGDIIRFNYNFSQLDSNIPLVTSNANTPFQITLGIGTNQRFLNLGLRGVTKSQKLEILVPHELGFGATIQVLPDLIRKDLIEKGFISSASITRPYEPIIFKAEIVEVR